MIESSDNFDKKLTTDIRNVLRNLARRGWKAKDYALKQAERVEYPLKKNGSPGKAKRCFYLCAGCGIEYKRGQVEVDHIIPVGPFKVERLPLYIKRLWCASSNLQVLCKSPCHAAKTKADRRWMKLRRSL